MRIWSLLLKKSLTENFIFCELKYLTKGSALTYRRANACNFENFNSLRSRLSEVLVGKSVLKICRKFTEDHPCQSAISIKLQSNFIEIVLQHGCSLVNSLNIFRTPFPRNTSRRLLSPLDGCSLFEQVFVGWDPRYKKYTYLVILFWNM